ncbi:MAG: hypothetical protein NTX25_11645, partial [Proteobacteria bacterium]|nr:hypothetical protein [Pseudomonadota bacterium]
LGLLLLQITCKPASYQSITDKQDSSEDAITQDDGDQLSDDAVAIIDDSLTTNEVTSTEVISTDVKIATNPEATSNTNTGSADSAKIACATAQKDGTLKSKTQDIVFKANTETCEFGKNDNLSRKNEWLRARREEYVDLSLAGMSRLCNIKFDSPKQDMKYDDEILLTLNQFVIASSQDFSTKSRDFRSQLVYPDGLMPDSDGLLVYKWLRPNGLADQKYHNSKLRKYCLGLDPNAEDFDKLCQIPKTDSKGSIQLNVPQDAFLKLAMKAGLVFDKQVQTETKARIGFVTLGDNNDGDCRHLDFQMSVSIEYVP